MQEHRAHTPAGGNRRARTWVWLLPAVPLVALALAVWFGPYLVMKIRPIRERVLAGDALGRFLGDRLRVSVADVERLDLGGLEFSGIALQVKDSSGVWQPLGELGRLAASWSPVRQLSGETLIHSFEAGPITIRRGALAHLARPAAPGEVRDNGRRRLLPAGIPRVRARHVRVGPVEVREGERVVLRFGLDQAEIEATAQQVEVLPRDAWVELPGADLAATIVQATVTLGADRAEIRNLLFTSERGRGALDAVYAMHDSVTVRADLFVDRLDPQVVARWLVPELETWPEDSLTGTAALRLGAGPATLDLALSGSVLGEACQECSGRLVFGGRRLEFSGVRLVAEACDLEAQGAYDSDAGTVEVESAWRRYDAGSRWLPWLRDLPLGGSCPGRGAVVVAVRDSIVVSGWGEVENVRPFGVRVDRARFAGRILPEAAVEADSAWLQSDGGRVELSGRWPLTEGFCDGWVVLDSVPIDALPEAWRGDAAGRVWGEFELSGVPEDPAFDGALRVGNPAIGGWRADRLAAGSLLLWPRDLRGSGTVAVRGLRQGLGAPADVDLRFSRWQDWIALVADVHRGEVDLHAEGRVDPKGQARIEGARFLAPRFGRWTLSAPFDLGWGEGGWVVDSVHARSEEIELVAAGRWVPSEDRIEAGARLEGLTMDRASELLGQELEAVGRWRARLDAAGSLSDPWVRLVLNGEQVALGDLDLGRVGVTAEWTEGRLKLDGSGVAGEALEAHVPSLALDIGRPLLPLLGLLPETEPAEQTGDTGARLLEALRDAPWRGRLEIERADLAQWAPSLGLRKSENGDVGEALEVITRVGGRPVPIRITAPWEIGPSAAGGGGLRGLFQGAVDLGGSLAAPELDLRGEGRNLVLARVPIGQLSLAAGYRNSLLSIDRLALAGDLRVSRVSGYYPVHLELLPPRLTAADWPVSIEASLSGLDLGLISGLTRWVPDAHGELSGTLTLGGTGTDPRLSGALLLRRGGLRVPERSERIFDIQADLRIVDDTLEVVSLVGRSGPKGVVKVTGKVAGPDAFDLRASCRNVRLFEQGAYEFEASADSLRIWTEGVPDAEAIPHVSGVVEVHGGWLRPQLQPGGATGSPAFTPWQIDLDLVLPGAVRVLQSNAKVDVGRGALALGFRWPHWNASGDLEILGGTYRLFNNNFTILEGTLELRDSGAGLDASVDVTGETYVTLAAAESQGGDPIDETVRVEVQVSGKPEELQVALSSEPPRTPEEIAELLSYRRLTGTAGLGSETQGVLFNEMVSRIEQSLSEQFPLSTTVVLETDAASGEVWPPRRVRLQQMITSEITGNYAQEIYQGTDWEIYVNYRLSRYLYLRAGMAHERDAPHGFNEEYNLDLKARFEYK